MLHRCWFCYTISVPVSAAVAEWRVTAGVGRPTALPPECRWPFPPPSVVLAITGSVRPTILRLHSTNLFSLNLEVTFVSLNNRWLYFE